jgi:hypothetical protein
MIVILLFRSDDRTFSTLVRNVYTILIETREEVTSREIQPLVMDYNEMDVSEMRCEEVK